MKYILYATRDEGQGYVQKLGEYSDIGDIEIRVGMFSDDVVLTIHEYDKKEGSEE